MKPKRCDCAVCEGDRAANRGMLMVLAAIALTGLVVALAEVFR